MYAIDNIIYPEQFNTRNIFIHSKCQEELMGIIETSGFKQKFSSLYRQRLRHLEERGTKCYQKSDWFEILKNTNGLYAMKFKSLKNLRIIFTFTDESIKNIAILLCTFEEKSKKDYKDAIIIANKRKEEINGLLR
ncbi:MAG: type II toxin-antitoxin system RelE/ParE family toxin [Caloramator sp.]|nr:type II toxin-antitoxin system RelE/ParE family toxin [Caloramator sp.]